MCLLAVVGAVGKAVTAVVWGRVAHETVLEAFIPLLVPLEVSNHFLLLAEHFAAALKAMEVFSVGRKWLVVIYSLEIHMLTGSWESHVNCNLLFVWRQVEFRCYVVCLCKMLWKKVCMSFCVSLSLSLSLSLSRLVVWECDKNLLQHYRISTITTTTTNFLI